MRTASCRLGIMLRQTTDQCSAGAKDHPIMLVFAVCPPLATSSVGPVPGPCVVMTRLLNHNLTQYNIHTDLEPSLARYDFAWAHFFDLGGPFPLLSIALLTTQVITP